MTTNVESEDVENKWGARAVWIAAGVIGLLFVVAFFTGRRSFERQRETLTSNTSKADNLNTAMGEFRRTEGGVNIERGFHYLNQWADLGGTKADDWQPSPLVEGLPPGMSHMADNAKFDRGGFTLDDYAHLNESIWCRETARWVSQEEVSPRFQGWLKEVGEKQGVDYEEQLRVGLNLFDWTIRNIRLEELLPAPPPPLATAGDSVESYPAAFRGIPGPGYSRTPSQVILFSRGDAYQRAWVFLLLARQAGIPGVMLALEPENKVGEPTPWCPALLIGGQLYLFESELGLPFTNDEGTAVTTWQELRANPSWLRRFDLEGIGDYKLSDADLKRVVPLFVATPDDLSRRMLALERSLKGDHHLQLHVPVNELGESLKKMEGLGRARLWHVPWEAIVCDEFMQLARSRNEKAQLDFNLEFGIYFLPALPLQEGRRQHIRGNFVTVDQRVGARDLYIASRTSNQQINIAALKSAEEAKARQHGKEDTTFFIALTHYETGNYDLAAEWFRDRIIEGAPDSPWVATARYYLARCYEALGEPELAREQYFKDTDSPQRRGNILRAGILKKK